MSEQLEFSVGFSPDSFFHQVSKSVDVSSSKSSGKVMPKTVDSARVLSWMYDIEDALDLIAEGNSSDIADAVSMLDQITQHMNTVLRSRA